MKRILSKFAKPSRFIFIISSLIYAVLFVIYQEGIGAVRGGFLPVVASNIIAFTGFALIGANVFFLFRKRVDVAKVLFALLAIYYIFSKIYRNISMINNFVVESDGALVFASTFALMSAVLAIVAIVFIFLNVFLNKSNKLFVIAFFMFLVVILFEFVGGLSLYASQSENLYAWPYLLKTLVEAILVPFVLFFGAVHFYGSSYQPEPKQPEIAQENNEEPVEEKVEETPEESKEEPAEEKPAGEPKEEKQE